MSFLLIVFFTAFLLLSTLVIPGRKTIYSPFIFLNSYNDQPFRNPLVALLVIMLFFNSSFIFNCRFKVLIKKEYKIR